MDKIRLQHLSELNFQLCNRNLYYCIRILNFRVFFKFVREKDLSMVNVLNKKGKSCVIDYEIVWNTFRIL